MALIAISIHLVILLGPDSVSKWGLNKWSKREAIFVFYLFSIWVIAYGLFLFLESPLFESISNRYFSLGIGVGFMLIFIWNFIRLTLVLPAIAVDDNPSLNNSLGLTKRHQITMFFVVAVFPLISTFPILYFPYESSMYNFISDIIDITLEIFAIAALSIAYKMFSEEKTQSLPVD